MLKVLFLIHDLGQGGAEKVLINLVNNMDPEKFDISVTALFGGGVNEQFLKPHIQFQTVWPKEVPGNSKLMKLMTPKQLHKLCVKQHYDIEISYLEGPSARVISGCTDPHTRLVCWIHSTFGSAERASSSFRNVREAQKCYSRFHTVVCVSQWTAHAFRQVFPQIRRVLVLYNTMDSAQIIEKSHEAVPEGLFPTNEFSMIGVGSLKPVKAFDKLIRIHNRLQMEGYPVHLYLLGRGPERENLLHLTQDLGNGASVTFLGYDTNPYKYVAKSSLFVCSSLSEGFSTAATEALIVGTPVCTVEVSGMKEMLGNHNEYGIITENCEDALYLGIKQLLDEPSLLIHYQKQAALRGKTFSTERTVNAVQSMLEVL